MELSSRDQKVIGSLVGLWIIASFIGGTLGVFQMFGPNIELFIDLVTGLIGLVVLNYLYKSVTVYGGVMKRSLTVIGVGVGFFSLSLAPHIWMHVSNPQAAGFFVFTHVATAVSFGIVAYGFYLLTEGGSE